MSLRIGAGAMTLLAWVAVPRSGGSDARVIRVTRPMLCVTEGSLGAMPDERLSVSVPKMRAYVNRQTAQTVEASLIYVSPTKNEARLGSGEVRRQFGLKLRAQDPCNLVYVMWRIEPKAELVVSLKTNPGEHTSAECANRGYRNIRPTRKSPVPALQPGDSHTLRAEMNGENLRVFVDNSAVWEGSLGSDVLHVHGPVGIRSDDAVVDFELRAGALSGAHADVALPCKTGPSESE